ncbi:MAG: aminoglycoside phosphotransferase family protein [Alphaproteobacteria bacterium]|nr:aminoglycoside phosphotransferase family protein [Alphaproteobacteria bacterium]
MTFKINHEKTNHYVAIPKITIQKMVKLVFPKSNLLSYKVISGGCANLNIKIMLDYVNVPYILRIYMRDKDAAFREQKIGNLLKDIIPTPKIYAIGDYNDYRFAIATFIKGITLRDLLLSNTPHDIKSLMTEAGFYLSKIQKIKFQSAGFFDKDLNVMPFDTANTEHDFIKKCLKNTIVLKHINGENCAKIAYYADIYKSELIDLNEKSLVHGDYDPANILVDLIDNHWKITGILDWEFAFSGSFLQDVANMLRYAHHMPTIYEESFLQSLKQNNVILPKNWRIKTHLLNIGSLLDCFIRHSPEERPNQSADIVNLITFFIQKLDEFHEKTH